MEWLWKIEFFFFFVEKYFRQYIYQNVYNHISYKRNVLKIYKVKNLI